MARITLVPGDGIGPEVVASAVQVLEAAGASIDWEEVEAGEIAFARHGSALPAATIEIVRRNRIALKGPMSTPRMSGYISPNIQLRQALEVFANVRTVEHYPPGGRSRHPGTKLALIRDVTEDLGRGAEQVIDGGESGVSLKVITRRASERLARFAFTWARQQGRRRVSVPNLSSILRATDGLYLRTVMAVASEFPDLTVEEEAVDGLAMHLIIDPVGYEVILSPNHYGGILCGVLAGLVGTVGMMPGALFGDGTALFEPGHGSAPTHAGKDRTNPVATILSGAMLLDHLGQKAAAERVRGAIGATIRENRHVTYDLGGTAGTRAMTAAICAQLR